MKSSKVLAQLFKPRTWFMFPKALLRVLDPTESVVLVYLINLCFENEQEDGVFCSKTQLIENLSLTEWQERAAIEKLIELRLIGKEKIQGSKVRFLRVNFKELLKLLNRGRGTKTGLIMGEKSSCVWVRNSHLQQDGVFPFREKSCARSARAKRAHVRPTPPKGGVGRTCAHTHTRGDLGNKEFELNYTTKNKTDFYSKCSVKLYTVISQKRKIQRKPNLNKWNEEFRKLNRIDTIPKKQIKQVLDWLIKNYGNEFVPVVYSASTFREKFHRIEDAMNRNSKTPIQTKIEITPETKWVLDHLNPLHWPHGSATQLPQVVAQSFSCALKLFEFKKRVLASTPSQNKARSTGKHQNELLLFHFIASKLTSPEDFVRRWWESVNKSVNEWEDWSGSLKGMQISENSHRLKMMFKQWSIEYTNRPETGEKLLELIYAN